MKGSSKDRYILRWLITGAVLVATMVVVGGITRLTQSGLSMVKWELFMGAVPPLDEASWVETFEDYQRYPEFQLKNSTMTLSEFKKIFFWEYLHRLLGRLIGLVFMAGFVFFLIKKWLDAKRIRQSIVLLVLGGFQGFLGWYMVKSGLIDMPDVSHYRLAMHLCTAFLTYAYIIWVIQGIRHPGKSHRKLGRLPKLIKIFIVLLALQIVYGAFVAGLDAGLSYPTWPKMGTQWIAEDVKTSMNESGLVSLFENRSSVQFVHRTIGVLVVLFGAVIWWRARRKQLNIHQVRSTQYLMLVLLLQFALGVFTLLFQVPLVLGVLHQFGALLLLTASTYALYHIRN